MRRVIALSQAVLLAITAGMLSLAFSPTAAQTNTSIDAGPRFRTDGPDAVAYGQNEGYPSCTGRNYVSELRCRVGAFSHFDNLFPSRTIPASKSPILLAAPQASQ